MDDAEAAVAFEEHTLAGFRAREYRRGVVGKIAAREEWLIRFGALSGGRDGTFLARFPRTANFNTCNGEVLAMLAPPPGEQYPVLVFSERCWGSVTNPCQTNAICPGVVFAYRGCPKGVRRYGMADASPNQPLARTGMRSPTAAATPTVRFTMSDAPPGALALLTLGSSDASVGGVALPLGLDPFGRPVEADG